MCRVITNKCQTLPGLVAQKWLGQLLAMLGNLILGDVARHSHTEKIGGYCTLENFVEKRKDIFKKKALPYGKNWALPYGKNLGDIVSWRTLWRRERIYLKEGEKKKEETYFQFCGSVVVST